MWWLREKDSGGILVINKRVGVPDILGERILGYLDRAHAIVALKINQEHMDRDLELVNECGKTMEEMMAWPVQEGFALRHREGWYWMHPVSRRVWYRRAQNAEVAWKIWEFEWGHRDGRKPRTPGRAKMEMVRGRADGSIEILDMWFV